MINNMIIINSKVLHLRKLCSYDYLEFIRLTKYKMNKPVFLEKFINNTKISSIVLEHPHTLQLVAMSIKYEKKLKKIIFDKDYDCDKLMKYLINEETKQ